MQQFRNVNILDVVHLMAWCWLCVSCESKNEE